jgi:hypothetical protein
MPRQRVGGYFPAFSRDTHLRVAARSSYNLASYNLAPYSLFAYSLPTVCAPGAAVIDWIFT